MIPGLAAALLFFILWLFATAGTPWREPGITFFLSVIVGAFLGTLCVSLPVGAFMTEDATSSHNIKALKDGNRVHGSFFLGTGSVDGKPAFTYYEEDNGAVRLKSVDADDAKVIEYDGTPKVTRECDDFSDVPVILAFPINLFADDDGLDCAGDYTFYVPKGSVKNNYILDAE